MTYVVTDNCIKCKYTDCVDVCPVDCFHEGPNFLVIDPEDELRIREWDADTMVRRQEALHEELVEAAVEESARRSSEAQSATTRTPRKGRPVAAARRTRASSSPSAAACAARMKGAPMMRPPSMPFSMPTRSAPSAT